VPAGLVYAGVFVAPLLFFFAISFWSVKSRILRPDFTVKNYVATWVQYWDSMANTMAVALMIAAVTTLLAFGFAYAVRFKAGRLEGPLLFLALITLFGGYLVKIYAWKSILGRDGILNQALLELGLVGQPIDAFLYNTNAVIITLTYFLLPFAILPIFASLRGITDAEIDSARDLGAGGGKVLKDIVIPRARPGIMAGFSLCFLISVGDYLTPQLVGGKMAMFGQLIAPQFGSFFNWPLGSAMSFSILAASLVFLALVYAVLARIGRP
jgi:spermidine/putrescine transport system permease protein